MTTITNEIFKDRVFLTEEQLQDYIDYVTDLNEVKKKIETIYLFKENVNKDTNSAVLKLTAWNEDKTEWNNTDLFYLTEVNKEHHDKDDIAVINSIFENIINQFLLYLKQKEYQLKKRIKNI